jgi:anti-anti-sigma regulatory factor
VSYVLPHVTEARVVRIAGRIDAVKVIEFEERVVNAVGGRRVVLDLTAATELAPHVVSLLRGALRRAVRGGATLAMFGAAPHVRSAIEGHVGDGVEFQRTVVARIGTTRAYASVRP